MKIVQSFDAYVEDRNNDPIDPLDIVSEGVFRTLGEAAAFAGVSKTSLVNAIDRGEIPVVRAGRTRRIPRKALKLYLAGRLAFRRALRRALPFQLQFSIVFQLRLALSTLRSTIIISYATL